MTYTMIILSGGTGTPKLLRGIRKIIPDEKLTVIVNTGEDIIVSGNLISPDLDTVSYLFSGKLDEKKWWGVLNDSFVVHENLKKLGFDEGMMIGDIDRSTHIFRSELMRKGLSLTQATKMLSYSFGIKANIIPMCDEKVDTIITTDKGIMHFQDFWVRNKGQLEVISLEISGINKAKPTKEIFEAFSNNECVIIGPSNPITSIGPILELKGMRELLKSKKVIAVSPIIGNEPVSGPAGKLMKAKGYEVSSKGVWECYKDIVDILVIDERDTFDGVKFDTLMTSIEKSEALAKFLIELLAKL